MSWTNRFVGIPWKDKGRDRDGVDCWGLFRLVYKEHLDIDLPSYLESYVDPKDTAELGPLITDEVAADWLRINVPRAGDGMLFNVKGEPAHTAVYVRDDLMLHVRRGAGSCVERYDSPIWKPRFIGYYCHPSRARD